MIPTALCKASRIPIAIPSLVVYHGRNPLLCAHSRRQNGVLVKGSSQGKRNAHSVAMVMNSPTGFFTSSLPTASQRVKPIGFDEEPCTLGLADGYAYADVDIGDILGPEDQYKIVRKLGWGLYATTWLVKDQRCDTYYAMKIVNQYGTFLESGEFSDPTQPRLYEREVLERISMLESMASPGAKHCTKLVEAFYATQEAGHHLCLVLELGGMSLQDIRPLISKNHSLPTEFVRMIVKQMCLALDYLHTECKVVHTDLKPSNILATLSQEDTRELVEDTLKRVPIARYPPREIMGITVEALQSQPLPFPGFDQRNPFTWVLKITDFGSAQWIGRRAVNMVQPIRLRAPEVVLGREWNEKIDIWSLGCLTFEFLTGKTLFRAQGGSTWTDEDDLLANHLELLSLSQFPPYFYQNSSYAMHHLKEDGSLKNIPGRMMYPKTLGGALARHKEAPINLDDTRQERDLALAFIARCLTLDPEHRASAAELLQHPWLRDFELGKPRPISPRMQWTGEKARTVN